MNKYILDENCHPVICNDPYEWGKWMAEDKRRYLKQDHLPNDVLVSTVFLGLDHSFLNTKQHKPVLWETMIFGGPHDGFQKRYTSPEDALEGHNEAIELIIGSSQ